LRYSSRYAYERSTFPGMQGRNAVRTAASDNLSVYNELRARGFDVRHMRFERTLETPRLSENDGDSRRPERATNTEVVEPFEPVAREVPNVSGHSPFRYFLDAAQRTLPSFHTDVIPISSSINAAAILDRNGEGECGIAPGTLQVKHTWLIPERSSFDGVNAALEVLRSSGAEIEDPLDDVEDEDEYRSLLSSYDEVAIRAKARADELRQRLEDSVLANWIASGASDRDWLVVDGTLRYDTKCAIGLAKTFSRSYLHGEDYEALYRLKQGWRTRAFRIPNRRFPVIAWYLRMWDATGRDPRYALVRIETTEVAPGIPPSTDEIDNLSGWILAERIPSAKADERWATLLYPIHQLERMLKRRLDAETRTWWHTG
jgi:hypothetical protein